MSVHSEHYAETVPPIGVHVASIADGLELAGPRPQRIHKTTYATFSSAAGDGNGVVPLLPASPKRIRALIIPHEPSANVVTDTEIANPSAGSGFTYTVPTPQYLTSVFAKFTASATVANRFLVFTIADASGNILYEVSDNSAVTAGTNVSWSLAQGASQINNATGAADAALPQNLLLQTGWTVNVTATGIQTTDQFSLIALTVATPASSVGWLSSNQSDCSKQQGARIGVGQPGIPPIHGTGPLYFQADPSSNATLTLTVIAEYSE